jgi:hypothetical protein
MGDTVSRQERSPDCEPLPVAEYEGLKPRPAEPAKRSRSEYMRLIAVFHLSD